LATVDVLRRLFAREVQPIFAPPEEILRMINIATNRGAAKRNRLLNRWIDRKVLSDLQSLTGREDLLDVAGRAPVIRLVNLMLFEAVKGGASDVHIQPYETGWW